MIPKYAKKGDIVHEIELGVVLKKGGFNIKRPDWKKYIGGYVLLLDYSNVSFVKQAKANGQPWLLGKGCD